MENYTAFYPDECKSLLDTIQQYIKREKVDSFSGLCTGDTAKVSKRLKDYYQCLGQEGLNDGLIYSCFITNTFDKSKKNLFYEMERELLKKSDEEDFEIYQYTRGFCELFEFDMNTINYIYDPETSEPLDSYEYTENVHVLLFVMHN